MLKRIRNLFMQEAPVIPSPKLKAFLETDELENIFYTAHALSRITESDEKYIRYVLKEWKEPQAIANLLNFPHYVPADIRYRIIQKGLNENRVIYFNLAAIVGIQSLENLGFTSDEKEVLKNQLFTFVEQMEDIRAMRATTSLQAYIGENDTKKIISVAENHNDGVRKNLLSLLVKIHTVENIDTVLSTYWDEYEKEVGILVNLLEQYRKKIDNAPKNKKEFLKLTLEKPLLGFIPNLKDIRVN